jgi:hypothetical protein
LAAFVSNHLLGLRQVLQKPCIVWRKASLCFLTCVLHLYTTNGWKFAVWNLYGSSMALRPGLVQDSTPLLLILDLLLLPWLHIDTRAILLGHSSFSFLRVLYN